MAQPTRPRGPGDTVARPAFFEGAFVRALVIALVLHVPFFPSRLFDVLRLALFGGFTDYDDPDAQAIVPIELDLIPGEPPAPPPPVDPPPPPKPPPGEGPADAGAPRDAGTRPPEPAPRGETPKPSAHPADAGSPAPLVDPVSAAGGAGKLAAKDANIQILIAGSVLRRHPLGPWAARLLVMIPEWRSFFEESPLDPIRDLNHILITAPRLKGDSSQMVVVMDHNLSPDDARDAVDRVLHRAGGVWLEDAPVSTGRARVGGATRLFALLPDRRLLVVLPEAAMDQLPRLKQAKRFRNSAEGAVVSLRAPAHAFKGFLPLPESLKWLRLALTPTVDGGADLAVDAGDRSSDDAVAHAAVLTREIEARRKVDLLGVATVEILDPVTFTAEGDVIRTRTHLTPQRVRMIMDWIEQQVRARFGAAAGVPGR